MDIIQSSEKANSVNSGTSNSINLELLRHLGELLPDQERVLGRDHPVTLRTRNNIAVLAAEAGDARALRLYHELLPDMERVLGAITPTH